MSLFSACRPQLVERRAVTVRGIVQGVGFRPYVHALASRLDLCGFVRNQSGTVRIEIEGTSTSVKRFLLELVGHAPPLAHIDQVLWEPLTAVGDHDFRIEPSESDASGSVFVAPDIATCDECLVELFDPADRRYRYPFLNCTHCGPRLTIISGAPYDRPRTTMAGFAMCEACREEYEDPANRRFHAQPTCCPACGPRLQLLDSAGQSIEAADPLTALIAGLRCGKIGAIKGLGGFHLACDAGNRAAVGELRVRKHRDEKPFAVMVRDLAVAESLCEISSVERELLRSPRRPIVLLRKRHPEFDGAELAPDNPSLGVMLPYTPLHHLLMREWGATPIVMTSGNRADEPIACHNADAVDRLGSIADLFLTHNRPIHVRCDDSVTRVVDRAELPIRRSRGYAPQPIALPRACSCPTLAVGGQFKATFALGRDRQAFLSHHLGDLDDFAAYRAFEADISLYQQLFAIEPELIVHDLHPEYASTRYAEARAQEGKVRSLAVQHHHAHMASCMAENGLDEPVIGVTFDGTGYGTDGAIWGGEFLVGDYRQFRRAAHLRYVQMPGGDRAIREPWRMGLAHLVDAGCEPSAIESRISPSELRTVRKMLERRFNAPLTSSAGRLFDAVTSIAGIRDRGTFEGQAAMQLEWLATGVEPAGAYPFELLLATEDSSAEATTIVDTRPLICGVAQDVRRATESRVIARRFHSTVVKIIVDVCELIRKSTRSGVVVLSGGAFMNAVLSCEAANELGEQGFRVYRHRLVPPNDGGLSLGQLAVACGNSGS